MAAGRDGENGASLRAIIRYWVLALVVGFQLAGCAGRPGPELLQPTAPAADSRLVNVLVATTRERTAPSVNVFTNDRARALNFASFTIAVPGQRGGVAAPLQSFRTVDQAALTRPAFIQRVSPRGERHDVGVFIHGYNNNFQEALFRLAQITADSQVRYPPILFAWPSQANVLGYVADRDAVAYSRDYLADLLITLTADPKVRRIRLVAHSMGGWLAIETLRQLRLSGRQAVLDRLDVMLAAPDIDVDVFQQQLSVIGPLSRPMMLFVSRDDRALQVSARLAGARERVGTLNVSDPRVQETARLARIQIVDISDLSPTDRLGHDRYVAMAALYPQLLPASVEAGQGVGLQRAGAFVLDAAGAIVAAPFSLIGQAQAGQ